ncbi:DNA packaging protein [Caldanaerobacter subterraneus subsp. yonseiensis KB-1]|uniref:DNA packaging protein n=1 Tax=Caldanaerobacter subterraneus subsp. yonseiensis KB-1 TaxID=1388761 RepID=U5CSI5_CALSX|nr:head-tail connector protein [Caldanaerobacter subterraneus]ERM91896.1 DNA packaging protein [Caldanaerobacter subterraneus subsp. yonseiensis KB-1]
MVIDLNLVKKYLRIDDGYTDEDDLIQLMVNNAITYMENAGVIIDETNEKQVQLAQLLVLVLVSDWYENRTLMTDKTSEKVRDIVQSILFQLKY